MPDKTKTQKTQKRGSREDKTKTISKRKTIEEITEEQVNINATIPEYYIVNRPGNASVIMNIRENQGVYTNASLMIWMDNALSVSTASRGLLAGIKRALFTADSFFLTTYTGTSSEGNKICFASPVPGDITELRIEPGKKKLVVSGAVICCSQNVILSTKLKFRNIFVNNGAFLSEVSVPADSTSYGMVWIGAYGGIEKIDIKENQMMKIDNGHFLMCDSDAKYTLGTVGGVKSTLFSGEGLVLNFKGPCSVYTQNRNLRVFSHLINKYLPKQMSMGNIG